MNNSTPLTTPLLRATLIIAGLIGLSPLAATATDPSLSDVVVQTPCGPTAQIPGAGERGKEGCSGNLLVSFPVGPLTLSYNSQYTGTGASYGFGRGMTALPRLVPSGSSVQLYLSDGTRKRYTSAVGNRWTSADQALGDTSVVTRVGASYELLVSPSGEKIVFKAVGDRWVPSLHTAASGLSTEYSYDRQGSDIAGIPSKITDKSTGRYITLQRHEDNYVVTSITDDRGRVYWLTYLGTGPGRFLTGIRLPDQSSYSLRYDTDGRGYLTSVTDPFGENTLYSFFRHGRLRGVGTLNGTISYEYTSNSITTQGLSSSGAPIRFEQVSFDAAGYASEFRSGDGAPSSSAPGILLGRLTHDLKGRVTSATDQLGNTTSFHYNADRTCASSASSPGTSPLPTCSVSNGVQVTTTRNLFNLPTTVIRRDPSGNQSTITFTRGADNVSMRTKTITDTLNRTTFNQEVDYQGRFPRRVRVRTTDFIDAYDELGRVVRATDSSGLESSYTYNQNGSLNTVTTGGVTTTMALNRANDGAATWSGSSPGGQETLSSNLLGTQGSMRIASASGVPAQLSLDTSSVVEPGIGTLSSTTTTRLLSPDGRLSSRSTETSTIESDGDSSSTSDSALNIN